MSTDARVAALSQVRQASTYAGLKKLGKALADAKFNSQPQGGTVRFVENRIKVPKYTPRISYQTEIVKTAMPVYEDRAVTASVVNGTKSIGDAADLASAGIEEGANFSVKVGDGDPARITLGGNRAVLTIGSVVTVFDFTSASGNVADKLTKALSSIPGLDASLDSDGKLHLQTENAEPLSIGDADAGTSSPLDALGLVAGSTEPGPATAKVQIGTEMVPTGTKQVEVARDYDRTGDTEIVAGVTAVRDKPSLNDVTLTAASRKQIVAATLALDAAIGPKELVKGVSNPFYGLRDRIGLAGLKTANTKGDLGLRSLQISVALKAYDANTAAKNLSSKQA